MALTVMNLFDRNHYIISLAIVPGKPACSHACKNTPARCPVSNFKTNSTETRIGLVFSDLPVHLRKGIQRYVAAVEHINS